MAASSFYRTNTRWRQLAEDWRPAWGTPAACLWTAFVWLTSLVLFYFVPVLLKTYLLTRVSPWVTSAVIPDVLGCLMIGIIKGWKAGVLLYILLTSIEAFLYALNAVSAQSMVWMTDAVPATILAAVVVRLVPWRPDSGD